LSTEPLTRALPEGRYGAEHQSGPKPRWRRRAYLAIALVVSFGIAWIAYVNLGAAPIDAERIAFTETGPDTVQVTIDVTRDQPDRFGDCIVTARDISGAESGRKEILVPPGAESMKMSTVIRSIGKPVTADVFGCSYDVPRYLSSP
jgi:hypothetical protein